MVTQAGIQMFVLCKDVSEIGKLVREYNEELRALENQTEYEERSRNQNRRKGKHTGKLHRYQQESGDSSRNGQRLKKKSMDRER